MKIQGARVCVCVCGGEGGVYDEYFFQGKRVPMPFSVKLLCALLHFNFPGGGDGVRTSGFQIIIAEKIHSIIVHEYQHVT